MAYRRSGSTSRWLAVTACLAAAFLSQPALAASATSSTDHEPPQPPPDLRITQTPSRTTLPASGGQVMYTVVVTNKDREVQSEATITQAIPSGLRVLSAKPSQGRCSIRADRVSCDLGYLDRDAAAQVLVTANASADAGRITTTARVRSGSLHGPAKATVIVGRGRPAPPADLRLTKRSHGDGLLGGTTVYSIDVAARGSTAAHDVRVTDTFAGSMRVLDAYVPGPGRCTKRFPVRCSLGTIPGGQTRRITMVVRPVWPGCRQRNTVSVISRDADRRPADNIAFHEDCFRRPTVRVTAVATRSTVRAGEKFDYDLVVHNSSPLRVGEGEICASLPRGLVLVRVSDADPGLEQTEVGEREGRIDQICWLTPTLGAGQSRSYRVTLRALRGTTGWKPTRFKVQEAGSDDFGPAYAKTGVRVVEVPAPAGGVTG